MMNCGDCKDEDCSGKEHPTQEACDMFTSDDYLDDDLEKEPDGSEDWWALTETERDLYTQINGLSVRCDRTQRRLDAIVAAVMKAVNDGD